LKAALAALRAEGIEPCSLEIRPDGSHRWHFTKDANNDDDAVDRELAEFGKRNGYG
jgi:hypothetical protein